MYTHIYTCILSTHIFFCKCMNSCLQMPRVYYKGCNPENKKVEIMRTKVLCYISHDATLYSETAVFSS